MFAINANMSRIPFSIEVLAKLGDMSSILQMYIAKVCQILDSCINGDVKDN